MARHNVRMDRRRFLRRSALAVGGAAALTALNHQDAGAPVNRIAVDAGRVLRVRPAEVGGIGINAHSPDFALDTGNIPFRDDARAAHVHLMRTVIYPDALAPDHNISYFDANVTAIISVGAVPLFVQYIKPGLPYLGAQETGGAGTVATNLVALVRRYMRLPYNIRQQYWEIGNEPDYPIDYRVSSPLEYVQVFNACHDALVAAGLRDHVVLCGPAVSAPYRRPAHGYSTRLMDAVLDLCAHSVDVVTYHHYAPAAASADELLNEPAHLDDIEAPTGGVASSSMAELLQRMAGRRFGRRAVSVGITEYNTNSFQHEIASGLWNLALTHHYLYNPRGRIATAFILDAYGSKQGGYGYYNAARQRDYSYGALWINGNLRGQRVLARHVDGDLNGYGQPWLLVTATRDTATAYIEVINRASQPRRSVVCLTGARGPGRPTIHTMKAGWLPYRGRPTSLGSSFAYRFPALSVSIFVFPLG